MAFVVTNTQASAKMAARKPFRNSTGSLWGEPRNLLPDRGYMPGAAWDLLREQFVPGTYVVFSYATPIAWATPGAALLTVPDVRYSNTTTQHQGACLHGSYDSGVGQVGQRVLTGAPECVRRGKGHSPYGPRAGW